jgi:hypothetical protein
MEFLVLEGTLESIKDKLNEYKKQENIFIKVEHIDKNLPNKYRALVRITKRFSTKPEIKT